MRCNLRDKPNLTKLKGTMSNFHLLIKSLINMNLNIYKSASFLDTISPSHLLTGSSKNRFFKVSSPGYKNCDVGSTICGS